jgi:hypothetical protein
MPQATLGLPIAFIEENADFYPVAVLGLEPGQNLFVAPDGRWLGAYLPAVLRTYPFRLGSTENGQQVLCIDSNALLSGGNHGKPLFDAAGTLSSDVISIFQNLANDHAQRAVTLAGSAALHAHGLLAPWPITIQSENGTQTIQGLLKIDEAALNVLPVEALGELRQTGALLMAYCQLLSMQHLPLLGQLAQAHENAAKAARASTVMPEQVGDFDLSFLAQNDTLSFGKHS